MNKNEQVANTPPGCCRARLSRRPVVRTPPGLRLPTICELLPSRGSVSSATGLKTPSS